MGTIALWAAAGFSCAAAVCSFFSRKRCTGRLVRILWGLSAAAVLLALGLLAGYLAGGSFRYAYVYAHTDKSLPLIYRISALWAGQEGSFLLWGAVLAIVGCLLWRAENKRAFGIYAAITFCILVMCCVSRPFAEISPAPVDGAGLAPALRDPWMAAHPPLVFIAYSLMAIVAALGAARVDPARLRLWVRASFVFLGLGILSGSVWAYRALGWGGYWAWDPIENAALVPWLLLCGILHGGEGEGRIRYVLPFGAALVGTFLARSGVLAGLSAHAYAGGGGALAYLLPILLAAALGIAAVLSLRRAARKKIAHTGWDGPRLFRWAAYAYGGAVLLGTVAPLILHWQTPVAYYTAVSVVFVLVYAALLVYRDLDTARQKYMGVMVLATVLTAAVALGTGTARFGWLMLLWVCVLPLSVWIAGVFRAHGFRYYLLHTGALLMIAGVILSSGLAEEIYMAAHPQDTAIWINGSQILLSDLARAESLTVPGFSQDVIIRGGEITAMPDGSLVIPCTTRPMINLFWAGGFLMVLGPWIVWTVQKIKRRFRPVTRC